MDVDPEELAAAVKTGDPDALRRWGKPIDVLVSGLRHALTAADGKVFGAGDFSMIEAACCWRSPVNRTNASSSPRGRRLSRHGGDDLRVRPRRLHGDPQEDLSPDETEQRRIGKNGVLSSGYGSARKASIGASAGMSKAARSSPPGSSGVYRNRGVRRFRGCGAISNRLRVGRCSAQASPPSRCGVVYQLTTRVGLPCLICALSTGSAALRQRPD